MTGDALVLIGRDGTHETTTLETHADRIEARGTVDAAHVVTYSEEPVRELRADLQSMAADTLFVLPAALAHSHETTEVLPRVFPHLDGDVRYCEPIGRTPVVTDLVADRAAEAVPATADTTLVLVGQGNSSQSYHRQMTEYHAQRVADRATYADVVTCYLLQNPAVECVRYNVDTERAVAVPLFLTENETTTDRIPAKLELDRGGVAYADPLGESRLVTEAIHREITRQRALDDSAGSPSFEAELAENARSVATDGEGPLS